MTDLNFTNAINSNMTDNVANYSVPEVTLDTARDQKETTYYNPDYNQQIGYYKSIPEIKKTMNAIGIWTVGKGYKTNPITQLLLMKIKGCGKDTFNGILKNQKIIAHVCGDSFAEIVRDNEGYFINLKPLGNMQIVANPEGIITEYRQLNKGSKGIIKFKPEQIFHLMNNRVADEIHGTSDIESMEKLTLRINEAMDDWQTVLHRNVVPVRIIEYEGDDITKIAQLKTMYETAIKNKEVIIIPRGTVTFANDTVSPNSTMNPLPTINQYLNYYYQVGSVPQIIVGGSQEMTEATAKIVYLTWEQTVEAEQLDLEEQVLAQLNLEIELEFPASLQNEMLSDTGKEESMKAATPEDTSVTSGGL